jgi:hypothetical protein
VIADSNAEGPKSVRSLDVASACQLRSLTLRWLSKAVPAAKIEGLLAHCAALEPALAEATVDQPLAAAAGRTLHQQEERPPGWLPGGRRPCV